MSRLLFFFTIVIAASNGLVSAQQHVFTNKEGVQIVAEIVSVNPDWKQMTIKKDGSPFVIPPSVLSLDDQQHIKNWLKERGITEPNQTSSSSSSNGGSNPIMALTPSIDLDKVSLDVKLNKKQVDSKRGRYSDYMKLDTRFYVFDIVVKSRSRETIPSPKVSYAVVWRERVSISGDNYESSSDTEYAITGEKAFSQLTYNREETVTTDRFEINEVIYDGNTDYMEDELIGVVAQVSLADGTVIGQFRTNGAEVADLTWAKASKLPGPGQRNRVVMEDDSNDDPRTYVRLQKGQSEEGPVHLADKKIGITAKVTPDTKAPDGVIVAIGGSRMGMSLFVKDRQVIASVNEGDGIKWVSKPLPLGLFVAQVDLNKSGLSLSIDGGAPANRADVMPFKGVAVEGIDAGRDTGTQVGDYPEDFSFAGEIEDLRILILE